MTQNKPNYIFETSWEVCNKVGGIHTVVSTKALTLAKEFKDNFILIGPDLIRETGKNPEFEEDRGLYRTWRKRLETQGLRIRIGRWKIIGKPIVFLIDFSSLFARKDEIFAHLWEKYGLDSLSGQWDYIEPAMFGYAAGQVIESFCLHHTSPTDKIIAQFHEWMTGAGILYLKENLPAVSTVFTTHATIVGRSIAGNRIPLYSQLHTFNGDAKAREFNIVAKQSLEKISAREADSFTTVSDITANECAQFLEKKVDIVTPNGFEDNFVPRGEEYAEKRKNARNLLRKVSEALLGYSLDEDVHFISTSGRYEFWNKGINMFIDALAAVNAREGMNKEIVAFILVPANNYGARKDLLEKLEGKNTELKGSKFLTHNLHDADFDPTLKKINQLAFTNSKDQAAKVIFVPTYLNGNDGIFNLHYYDLLVGMDLTIYPSYYEPWGYTPLESLAFHIPSITTTLAGFGLWIQQQNIDNEDCLGVIKRTDENYNEAVESIANKLIICSYKNEEERRLARDNAYFVSRTALWKNLVKFYYQAYSIAIKKSSLRKKDILPENRLSPIVNFKKLKINRPHWRTVTVQPRLPEALKGLDELSKNLWWAWNDEAYELFRFMSPRVWEKSEHNPVKLLKEITYEKLLELEKDSYFLGRYHSVYKKFKNYLEQEYRKDVPKIAYFSMEYGIANPLKIYSGGLGILAGDYLKQASDSRVDMIAVGFLYKYGYFTQKLSINGEQMVSYEAQNFSDLPVELQVDEKGSPILVRVALPGRSAYAQIWKVNVGRIPLYLLDTDIERNRPEDREISHYLYGGDNENRLKQEIFLGIGGIRALQALGIHKDVYHCNEGHAAFIGIERINHYRTKYNFTFAEALEIVRASTLYTTHTPVPAGHDAFPEEMIMSYMGHYPDRLKISWEEFVQLGKLNPEDKNEKFSMSHLAANVSQEINAVSSLHGEVTKQMFNEMWPGYFPEESHIGYVTNGVHYQTWAAQKWKNIIDKYFSEASDKLLHNKDVWAKIYEVPDKEIWEVRNQLRADLVDFIVNRINSYWNRRRKDPKQVVAITENINKDVLTLGFARRFATYKRAYLLFTNLERLSKLLNNPDKPVQIIFAGKAHPADKAGQDLIKQIVEISRRKEFIGKIIFLENYDIELAQKLVQGVDVWINTPTRPLEASGTSGMKAVMNGVLNLSVLDGWWVEGYKEGAGWALPQERTYENQEFQNQLDAEMLYGILENEIVPLFYKRNESGIPVQWMQYIKKCISQIAPEFTTARMLDDYIDRFYIKMAEKKKLLRENDFEATHNFTVWKKRMLHSWESIQLIEVKTPETEHSKLDIACPYKAEVKLDLKEVDKDSIGIEIVVMEEIDGNLKIVQKQEMELVSVEEQIASYKVEIVPAKAGVYRYALRMFPKHPLLTHRQDFPLVRWI